MGKTANGAVWLDPKKTSPYEFYQYWRNVGDGDVLKCIRMLTFLPLEQIDEMDNWEGSQLNKAKEILAFELTKLVHGEDEATKAQTAASALFGSGANTDDMPSTEIDSYEMSILDVMLTAELVPSKKEARRLIEQGGVAVNNEKVTDVNMILSNEFFADGYAIIKKGKKVFHKIIVK